MGKPNVINWTANLYYYKRSLHYSHLNLKDYTMNLENRATKVMLKNMPVFMAEELMALYKIKKPYKEILMATCVKDMPQFEAMKHLSEQGIHLGYRTFLRKQAKALEMFRVAHMHYKNR